MGDYYGSAAYRRRADCIYRQDDSGYTQKDNPFHGEDMIEHDLGKAPGFDRAVVLLSDDFRFFGRKCETGYRQFEAVAAFVDGMRQGHRVNFPQGLQQELKQLEQWIWAQPAGSPGRHIHDVGTHRCLPRDDSEESVVELDA